MGRLTEQPTGGGGLSKEDGGVANVAIDQRVLQYNPDAEVIDVAVKRTVI